MKKLPPYFPGIGRPKTISQDSILLVGYAMSVDKYVTTDVKNKHGVFISRVEQSSRRSVTSQKTRSLSSTAVTAGITATCDRAAVIRVNN